MTSHRPPRLALALLDRLVPDADSLAGDLIEEFQRRPSGAWFWWQVLTAMALTRFGRSGEIRPLRLVDLQPVDAQERSRRLSLRFREVNLSASPVYSVGGLGLACLLALVSILMPVAWLFLVASIAAGIALGVLLIAVHA